MDENTGLADLWDDDNFNIIYQSSKNTDDVASDEMNSLGTDGTEISCSKSIINSNDFTLSDSHSVKGLCGLKNLGNTCFMAAGLQSLMCTSNLVGCFFSYMASEELQFDLSTVTGQFAVLLKQVWSGDFKVISPQNFKEVLGISHPQFKDFQQHDCQEFIALVLDSLHEFLNSQNYPFNFKDCCKETRLIIQNWTKQNEKSSSLILDVEEKKNETKFKWLDQPCFNISKSIMDTDSEFKPNDLYINMEDRTISKNDNQKYLGACNEFDVVDGLHSSETQSQSVVGNGDRDFTEDDSTFYSCVSNIKRTSKCSNAIDLEDIFKEAKTPNVNLLMNDDLANNLINFDSSKFVKYDSHTRQELPSCQEAACQSNSHKNKNTDRLIKKEKVCINGVKTSLVSKNSVWNNVKRIRLDQDEKNVVLEKQKRSSELSVSQKLDCSLLDGLNVLRLKQPTDVNEALTAEKQWDEYSSKNKSVVVDTFQGQFKSTVVCSMCSYVSVTYEPFMYLSVPIPHATERQIVVTLVIPDKKNPIQYLINLHKQDKVKKVKQALCKVSGLDDSASIIIAEVLDCHIAKLLDENMLIKYMNDVSRSIYAFSLLEPLQSTEIDSTVKEDITDNYSLKLTSNKENSEKTNGGWRACAICLEEMMDLELKIHPSCGCILCSNCIEMSYSHYGGAFSCPVCANFVDPGSEFVDLTQVDDLKPELRILKVPVVFRHDILGDGDNNKKSMKLFGHPLLVQLPSELNSSVLYNTFDVLMSHLQGYKLLLVDGQGYHCSRCMYTLHCKGCEIKKDSIVILQAGDNIAVRCLDLSTSQQQSVTVCDQHISMSDKRINETITIYDCIRAFSKSETLDDNNPWFCPECQVNQCATKTLTVWKYPDVLIVYLKRFVFYEYSGLKIDNKVIFPVEKLNVAPFSHGPVDDSDCLYDLYACVCHFGGVNAGHYTAYIKQLLTKEWYYCNDDNVKTQEPQEEDYNHAYILFYQRTSTLTNIFEDIPSPIENYSNCERPG